jgi:RNA-directed DNA polymerase
MTKTFGNFYRIDWKHCGDTVYRLQCAIAKAWRTKDLQRVRRLQDRLMGKFEARALAVKKVRTNSGGKTPGVDGVVWDNDDAFMEAIDRLRNLSQYEPIPVKRVYIPKAKGGRRPLGIPTMYDRAVQTLAAFVLVPIAECTADPRSYGYRPHKSAHDAAAYLKLALGSPYAKRWVLEADIETFFDTLSHEWLLNNIPMDRKLLKKFLKAGFMDPLTKGVHVTSMGTPQGGVISPILANIALDGLEKALGERFRVVRYADDFVVMGASPGDLKSHALPAVRAFLAPRGLTLSQAKTKITSIEDGFDFLGFTFREYKDKARVVGYKKGIFLVTPAKAKIQSFRNVLKQTFQSLRQSPPHWVIVKVNPILRGWAQYYKPVTSKKVFSSVGRYVWELLWKWCRKKHPTKPLRALKRKYFTRVGGNNWVFYARGADRRTTTLFQLAWTKIVRHVLCRTLNPFLPENRTYYLQRRAKRASQRAVRNATQSKLLTRQRGVCPVCAMELLDGEPLEVHHIKPRKLGGTETMRNLLLLHQFCHKQVTYSKDDRLKAAWRKDGIVAEEPSSTRGASLRDASK